MGPPTAKENPNYLGCPPAGPQSSSHIYIDSIFSYKYTNFALGDLMNTIGDSTRDPSAASGWVGGGGLDQGDIALFEGQKHVRRWRWCRPANNIGAAIDIPVLWIRL